MRNSRGQAVTALIIFCAIFVIGALAALAYELNMVNLAREQLKNCVQAAAMAGATSLASSGNPTDAASQTAASDTAANLFKENSILGALLGGAVVLPNESTNPPPGNAGILVRYIDPITKAASASGTMLQVIGKYSYVPTVGQWIGLGTVTFPVQVSSNAGSPILDVCIVYDISGNMDDQTPVSFVQRYWDYKSNPPGIVYMIPKGGSSDPTLEGNLSRILCAPDDGLNSNGSFPQGMENVIPGSGPNCPIKFSEAEGPTKGLRGTTNTAAPPGNYVAGHAEAPSPGIPEPVPMPTGTPVAPGGPLASGIQGYKKDGYYYAPGSATTSAVIPSGPPGPADGSNNPIIKSGTTAPGTVTDVVINLDNSTKFAGWQNNGFDFPTIGSLVEAARGNLDSAARATAAGLDLTALGNITPKAGYKNEYTKLARANREPLGTMAEATQTLVDTLAQTGNVKIALLPFNDQAGFCALCGFTAPQVSSLYPSAGNGSYDVGLKLLPAAGNNYATVSSALPNYDNWGNRATAHALDNAIQTLTKPEVNGIANYPRNYANKAIILITNGVPEETFKTVVMDKVQAAADARAEAKLAKDAGIPIYVVGISQNKNIAAEMDAMYTDKNSNLASGGVAGISGMGAKYYRIDWSDRKTVKNSMTSVFGNIVRNLVVLN